ncbi:hypothetical protein [Achromobacter aloeverae]
MPTFFRNIQTQQFVTWLSTRIAGAAELNFVYSPDRRYRTLSEARDAYSWPPRTKTIVTPEGKFILPAGASLAANLVVLDALCRGLRGCLDAGAARDEALLADWVQAILVWGGVYTRHRNGGGNAGWLDARRQAMNLTHYLRVALDAFNGGAITFDDGPIGLRSNAGLTKVYSLAVDDFVIYDSRVAAAFAWLVTRWAREAGEVIPDHLKFACMRANEGNVAGRPPGAVKVRSPDTVNFPYFAPSIQPRDHRRHAVWNQRANYVLSAALGQAHARHPDPGALSFQTVRDVEAALFVMGADLRHALD